jgi:hypothetical protein
LLDTWPGALRHVILELLPVEAISDHFDPTMGQPTQELYSIALVQTAAESDAKAVEPVLDDFAQSRNLLPREMAADTAYCGDKNVQMAQALGAELIGPVPSDSASQSSSNEAGGESCDLFEDCRLEPFESGGLRENA